MSTTTSSPAAGAAGVLRAPAAPAPAWLIWSALVIVYVIWASTYLAIRVMVETMPPLLFAGLRFLLAGAVMLAVLAARGRSIGVDRPTLGSALLVGALLMGANGVVTIAEQEVPSGVAALLIASVPLWVILLRRIAGERVTRASIAAVAVGFAGVSLLMLPGEQSDGASLLGLAGVVAAALMWATGSFASSRVATYAYVNPVVAIALGALILGEVVTSITVIGATIIVVSVALVIRLELR